MPDEQPKRCPRCALQGQRFHRQVYVQFQPTHPPPLTGRSGPRTVPHGCGAGCIPVATQGCEKTRMKSPRVSHWKNDRKNCQTRGLRSRLPRKGESKEGQERAKWGLGCARRWILRVRTGPQEPAPVRENPKEKAPGGTGFYCYIGGGAATGDKPLLKGRHRRSVGC